MRRTTGRTISAVVVNHNTSRFTELMLRPLDVMHERSTDLAVTVYDNASTDDTGPLIEYTEARGIPFVPTGLTTNTENNSHGELLDRFVLGNPDADYYLLLDADVCFIQPDTIGTMVRELSGESQAFGIGVRQTWDGNLEVPLSNDHRHRLYYSRLHPCCALIRNTEVFRLVAGTVGFSCVNVLHAGGEEFLDTAELLTRVMQTHGLRHLISSAMVLHFFSVSYDPRWMERKIAWCDRLLADLRSGDRERFLVHATGST